MNKLSLFITSVLLMAITAFFTYKTFFASFGPVLVDYVAFLAGIILVMDATLAFRNNKESRKSSFVFPFIRIIIGVCIFTIHLMQYLRDGKLGIY
ncbi:hypothetical protein ACFL1T_03755 [Chlamydiota bacterium]